MTAAKTALRTNPLKAEEATSIALLEAGYPETEVNDFAKTMVAMAEAESTTGSRLDIR